MIKLIIPGQPVPWSRPRHGGGKHFNKAEHARALNRVNWEARLAMRALAPLDGPERVSARIVFAPPKTWSKKLKASCIGSPVMVKPDLSNLLKLVEDGCQGQIYVDDKQIVAFGFIEKIYGEQPRTEFYVERYEALKAHRVVAAE